MTGRVKKFFFTFFLHVLRIRGKQLCTPAPFESIIIHRKNSDEETKGTS